MELIINNGGVLYSPLVEDGVEWQTERAGAPGQLKFKVVKDGVIDFQEGNPVTFRDGECNVFYGYVFTKKRDKNGIISVTAYDQLRYLKNKDTYNYENITASQLIQRIAGDLELQLGLVEDTGYRIPSRVETNTTYMDMIQQALGITLENRGVLYVLYDDFGLLTLKNMESLKSNILITPETAGDYDYTSTIDDNTYNKVKLTYENEEDGYRDVYMVKDSENIQNWGVLQYYDTLQEGENGAAKAEALLKLYNKKTRNLTIKSVLGDSAVRAGAMVGVMLNIGDMVLQNYMVVEKCKHKYNYNQHLMDLTLRGGEFVG